MRNVILPVTAGVLCHNKLSVQDLVPGDCVSGYDTYNRRVTMARIVSIEPLPPVPKIRVPLTRFMTVTLTAKTVILTPNGERTLAQNVNRITGYCYKNPKNLLVREVDAIMECKETVEVVRLTWDEPDYIWTDGILVGAKWTS